MLYFYFFKKVFKNEKQNCNSGKNKNKRNFAKREKHLIFILSLLIKAFAIFAQSYFLGRLFKKG